MGDEVVIQPGDTVIVAEPPAVETAVIETATAVAVAEGVRLGQEEGSQWQRQTHESMASLLSETREQRVELQTQIQELILRVKDQTEQQTVMNSRLSEVSQRLGESPTLTPPIVPTTPEVVEVIPVTPPERNDESTGKPDKSKSETPEERQPPKPKRRLI